ncbi:MAG: SDR family NAD(P)-dependent oxidoreductase, partial [Paraburkholderia sp.]|uniref:SDR family NAD(P)-dependent oxidoreductase n=1 Tax=Paraburkholderia sp. TaxID=1926495 RepID=UPI003C5EB353
MNRVVLVTGACGGIGSALCRRFVAEGDTVLALDLEAAALDALAAALGADRVTP